MLASRTQLILAYLRGVADGSLRRDDEVLRMIGGLMAGLPVEGGQAFRAEFETVRRRSVTGCRTCPPELTLTLACCCCCRSMRTSSSRATSPPCPSRCSRSITFVGAGILSIKPALTPTAPPLLLRSSLTNSPTSTLPHKTMTRLWAAEAAMAASLLRQEAATALAAAAASLAAVVWVALGPCGTGRRIGAEPPPLF